MNSISVKIAALLQNLNYQDVAQNYLKNVHGCVVELKDAINKATSIINSAYNHRHITREESGELQNRCKTILESFYSFKERLEQFSINSLRETGVKVSPSISQRLQRLIKARGAQTHIREPSYTYETSDGQWARATCDVAPNSYQGECQSIHVAYEDKDSRSILGLKVDDLLKNIEFDVKETLSKYYAALEKHLKKTK
jgi:hypothetical protein